ncbi:MAG: hypothetical protein AAGA60_31075 [Cyanobacteria bacterium P01_E01_bin.42]
MGEAWRSRQDTTMRSLPTIFRTVDRFPFIANITVRSQPKICLASPKQGVGFLYFLLNLPKAL